MQMAGSDSKLLMRMIGTPWLIVFGLCVGAVVAHRMAHSDWPVWASVAVLFSGTVCWLCFRPGSGKAPLRAIARGNAMAGRYDAIVGRHTLVPGSEGVYFEGPGGWGVYPWRICELVQHSEQWTVLWMRNVSVYPIPARAFGTREQATVWSATAEQLREASGQGDAYVLRLFISSRDVPCIFCAGELRGVESGTCPGCGSALVLKDLVRAQVERVRKELAKRR